MKSGLETELDYSDRKGRDKASKKGKKGKVKDTKR